MLSLNYSADVNFITRTHNYKIYSFTHFLLLEIHHVTAGLFVSRICLFKRGRTVGTIVPNGGKENFYFRVYVKCVFKSRTLVSWVWEDSHSSFTTIGDNNYYFSTFFLLRPTLRCSEFDGVLVCIAATVFSGKYNSICRFWY